MKCIQQNKNKNKNKIVSAYSLWTLADNDNLADMVVNRVCSRWCYSRYSAYVWQRWWLGVMTLPLSISYHNFSWLATIESGIISLCSWKTPRSSKDSPLLAVLRVKWLLSVAVWTVDCGGTHGRLVSAIRSESFPKSAQLLSGPYSTYFPHFTKTHRWLFELVC